MAACGTKNSGAPADNGDTTSQTTCSTSSGDVPCRTTTHLLHRSLVSNYVTAAIDVVDATQNRVTGFAFPVGAQPTTLQPSPDGTLTLVNNTGSSSISSFNNLQEKVKATIHLGGFTESYVTSQNNKSGFAAVPNYSNGNFNTPGAIVRFNPTDGSLNTAIPFPNVLYLAMDPAEKHLLAFTNADDDAHWVDLTTIDSVTQVPMVSVLTITGLTVPLSRPVAAFFSADSNTAFILSCGIECGGTDSSGNPTQASVTEIDVSNDAAAPAVINQWLVNGARIGFIDLTAHKLYVAGSTGATPTDSGGNKVEDGWFTVIDLAAGTAASPIQIGNGVKRWIRDIHGTFWVASLNCGVQSCVSLVHPAAGTASVLPIAKGNATGISLAAIKGDSTDDVYTIEGGELSVYDQQGNPVISEFTTDIRGQGVDVIYIN